MSRQISIIFCDSIGKDRSIDIRAPYFLFGCQETSVTLWRIPQLRELGIVRLTELGECDPIVFVGWQGMSDLDREIGLLQHHLKEIEFDCDIKASWVSHLVFCYQLLIMTAPKESEPIFMIG